MSFVEKSIILCPYLGGSSIGGLSVYLPNINILGVGGARRG